MGTDSSWNSSSSSSSSSSYIETCSFSDNISVVYYVLTSKSVTEPASYEEALAMSQTRKFEKNSSEKACLIMNELKRYHPCWFIFRALFRYPHVNINVCKVLDKIEDTWFASLQTTGALSINNGFDAFIAVTCDLRKEDVVNKPSKEFIDSLNLMEPLDENTESDLMVFPSVEECIILTIACVGLG